MTRTLKRTVSSYGTSGSLDFRLVACAYPKCGRTGRVRLWTGDGRAVAFCDLHALYLGRPARREVGTQDASDEEE